MFEKVSNYRELTHFSPLLMWVTEKPTTIAVRAVNHECRVELSNCSMQRTKPHAKQTVEAEAGETGLRSFYPKVMQ